LLSRAHESPSKCRTRLNHDKYSMTPKPTRGGARKGAGRKPRITPRKSITVRLEPQDADRLRELCRSEELSQANWIAKQIRIN
jgi:hypothetical protein